MTARARLNHWCRIDDALTAGDEVSAGDAAWHQDYRWSRQMADDAAGYSAEYGLPRDWMFAGRTVRFSSAGAAGQSATARRRQCGVPHEQSVPVTQSTPPTHADASAAHFPAAGKRHLLQWWEPVRWAATRLLISLARAAPTARAPLPWRTAAPPTPCAVWSVMHV